MKSFIKLIVVIFTPFIVSIVDIINGVNLYMEVECGHVVDPKLYVTTEHATGSSILLTGYVLCRSSHMCKYYKLACWSIMIFHIYAELYIHTGIEYLWFAYLSWIIHTTGLILCIIYILGKRTRRLIRRAYRYV